MIMLDRSSSMLFAPFMSGDEQYVFWNYYNVSYIPSGARAGWWFFRDNDYFSTAWMDPKSAWSCGGNGVCLTNFSNQPAGTFPSWGKKYNGYWDRQHWYPIPDQTLWSIALHEIGQVTSSYDDPINGANIKFGFATFSDYYAPWAPAAANSWAKVWSEAGAYTNSAAMMASMNHPQQGAAYGNT